MAAQSREEIKADVLEVCSEDDCGSWELWWHISAKVSTDQISGVKHMFVNVVSNLVSSGKLIAKAHSTRKHNGHRIQSREVSGRTRFCRRPPSRFILLVRIRM